MRTLFTAVLPAAVAVFCGLALLPWMLGVPGVENDYARGWSLGLNALLLYLAAYASVALLKALNRLGWLALPRNGLDGALVLAMLALR